MYLIIAQFDVKKSKVCIKFVIKLLSRQNSANYTWFFLRSIWKRYLQLKIFILGLVVNFIRYGNMIIYYDIKAT